MKILIAVLLLCCSCTAIVTVTDKVETPIDSEVGKQYFLVLTNGKVVKLARCSKKYYNKMSINDTIRIKL